VLKKTKQNKFNLFVCHCWFLTWKNGVEVSHLFFILFFVVLKILDSLYSSSFHLLLGEP